MSTSTVTPIRQPQGPFSTILIETAAKLQALAAKAPRKFSIYLTPDEPIAWRECLSEAAGICDEMLAAVGHQLDDHAPCRIDIDLFRSAFSGAIDGNALYEFERVSEALIEDHNNMIRERA